MSDLENLKEGLRLYHLGEDISLNHLRIKTEDIVDRLDNQIYNIVGKRYSENDIIIEAKLNNNLVKANELYEKIINLIID